MRLSSFVVLLVLYAAAQALKVVTLPSSYRYRVEDDYHRILFTGGDVAVFVSGKWCVHSHEELQAEEDRWTLEPKARKTIEGEDPVLGGFVGEVVDWSCNIGDEKLPIETCYKNFNSAAAILFEVEWTNGATNTTVDGASESAMTRYPSLQAHLPHALSWEGSFTQSKQHLSIGRRGGPTVFYNGTDPNLETVVVGGPWKFIWKSFSAGDNQNWRKSDDTTYWAPGTSGRISEIPKGYRQSILLYQGQGITSTIDSWGQAMQASGLGFPKLSDVTLEKIGYQTDNGAMYCFCKDKNCSHTLLQEIDYLRSLEVPMGYLSFQGSGTSSGRGTAAPWCVDTWGVDGGLDPSIYPMDIDSFQKALGLPLQLYAPYFCPDSPYFDDDSQWEAIPSDSSLSNCKNYEFQNVQPSQSRQFYDWFLDKGIKKAGMVSFESDFMNQNYNCVPAFITNISAAQVWQQGMAGAAFAKNITIQWCYSSPTDVLASVDLPAVTNFRVSSDFCYGHSWDIGESSFLVWAMGVAPSKDTLWSTANNHTEIPGCPWTPDHEASAAELHVVLALMSTGPVGLSDAVGHTNATLLKRIMMKDGTLLKPSKPVTAIDSTFLTASQPILAGGSSGQGGGYVYGTACVGNAWTFVSFLLQQQYEVKVRDFYPLPQKGNIQKDNETYTFAYRQFGDGSECQEGQDAVSSGCIRLATVSDSPQAGVFIAPEALFDTTTPGQRTYTPTITAVWQPCERSRWILLGELSKYVPISPVRFKHVRCTESGVLVGAVGSPGEVVTVTALKPEGWQEGLLSLEMRYSVVKKTATLARDGRVVKFDFSDYGFYGDSRKEE